MQFIHNVYEKGRFITNTHVAARPALVFSDKCSVQSTEIGERLRGKHKNLSNALLARLVFTLRQGSETALSLIGYHAMKR